MANEVTVLCQTAAELEVCWQHLACRPAQLCQRSKDFLEQVLKHFKIKNWGLGLYYCSDSVIRKLNRQYRAMDQATDILSFAADSGGDLVLSLPALLRNCTDFVVSAEEELQRLLVHGVLHLAGWDHCEEEDIRSVTDIKDLSDMLYTQEKYLIESLRSLKILPL